MSRIVMDKSRGRLWSTIGAFVLVGLVSVLVLSGFEPETQAADQPQTLPADLALVPADAAGFAHVRLADLWKHEMFAAIRSSWERAGEKALSTLDKRFLPAPSSIERATVFFVLDPITHEPKTFGILRFSAPFSTANVVKTNLPNAKTQKVGNKTIFTSEKIPDAAVYFPDDRHMLIGPEGAISTYLTKPVSKSGPMSEALKLAASGRAVVAAANISSLPIPPDALEGLPGEIRPLLKADTVMFSVDLGAEVRVELKAGYKDAAASKDAEKAIHSLVVLGRKEVEKARKELESKLYDPKIEAHQSVDELPQAIATVFGIGALNHAEAYLATPNLFRVQDNTIAFSATVPKEVIPLIGGYGSIAIGLLLPAVQKVRASAGRSVSQNNLKQIGLAIHNYHDANGSFPSDVMDKNGKALLSWRVAVLPYIEQSAIYGKFKMDEPWDGPTNKQWSKVVIKTFLSPSSTQVTNADGYALTSYKGISGPGTAFEAGKKIRITDFTDGTSNTVMVIESGDPIPWAKPGDFPFDPAKPLPKLAAQGMGDLFLALLADGSVRTVNTKTVSVNTLKAVFTRAGGEVIGNDW